ncbi:hypothetical protein [Pseudomonas syringae pv. coryli]|uniref:hypothetical protein n=1 Tax=Pseudomonas syringae pv. coryli TaxID=317659 RepID=UPI003D2AC05C
MVNYKELTENRKQMLKGVLCVSPFKPSRTSVMFESIRARLLGLYVKWHLHQGRGVVVVGQCGAGKTFLLSRAFPGRVVSPDMPSILAGRRTAFELRAMPSGMFAVDESSYFEATTFRNAFEGLKLRKVAFAVQHVSHIRSLKLHELFKDRLRIVFLGSRNDFLLQASAHHVESIPGHFPYRVVTIEQNINQLRSPSDANDSK